MRLPDRRVSEATTLSDDEVSDDGVAVGIEEDENNERISFLGTKLTSPFSLFGALRRRRVPDATAEVSRRSHAFYS